VGEGSTATWLCSGRKNTKLENNNKRWGALAILIPINPAQESAFLQKKHGASVADLELRNTIVVSSVCSLSCFTRYKDTIFCRDTPLLQVQSLDFHSFFVAL